MDRSTVTLDRIRTFVRVAERGSLSAVAREIGAGQSTITRQLNELEEAVGVPLLTRTTRRVALTDEGQRYYANCLNILRLVEQANDEAVTDRSAPAGNIRISCTSAFGILHVSRLLFDFQDLYPAIGLDFSLTDARVDLVREGVDIAMRLGPLDDSAMKLHALGMSRRILVAAPSYLRKVARPETPEDLARLETIRMTNVAGSDSLELTGAKDDRQVARLSGMFRVDHGLAARQALLAGRGIGPAHMWLVDDLIRSGELEVLLPDYALPPVPLSMLIVPERSGITRVRLLVDFLAERVRDIPGIE
ncbi:LysR family transcriptional regulator [Roseovarius sp.]|uniref:LysR family transcriptional regulator n=1 Tax=Roseovarius sp. TaxID=1486281 RepID=UPI003BAB9EDB